MLTIVTVMLLSCFAVKVIKEVSRYLQRISGSSSQLLEKKKSMIDKFYDLFKFHLNTHTVVH